VNKLYFAPEDAPMSISYYRNEKTGELAPPHIVGTDENGRRIYQFVEGWQPADATGVPIACESDYDGNWLDAMS
jgi:hypothetical protein